MAAAIQRFRCDDMAPIEGRLLINGHIFQAKEGLRVGQWAVGNFVTFHPEGDQGFFRVTNQVNRLSQLFQVVGESPPLSTPGTTQHLRKTVWIAPIDSLDCAACDPKSPSEHQVHEVVMRDGKGVFVTPASWQAGHELRLIVQGPHRYLLNQTTVDALKLPDGG